MPIYDLSLPISPALVTWPGDPPVRITPCLRIARGDKVNVSELCLGLHTGTHIDPPSHLDDHGMKADELPLELLMGKAWVCSVEDKSEVDVSDLQGVVPLGATRLLLKTSNSALWRQPAQKFTCDFVTITVEAAYWIVDHGIRLVGVDYLSVERPDSVGHVVHDALLRAGLIIAEGLDLSPLQNGWYNFYCLPLRVVGGDGAPARAVAVGPLEDSGLSI